MWRRKRVAGGEYEPGEYSAITANIGDALLGNVPLLVLGKLYYSLSWVSVLDIAHLAAHKLITLCRVSTRSDTKSRYTMEETTVEWFGQLRLLVSALHR